MSEFKAFIRKEFYHIMRDRRTMLILLGIPIVLIVLFGFALSTEVRNIRVAVLMPEPDNIARQVVQHIDAGEYFTVSQYIDKPSDISKVFREGNIDIVLSFPPAFSKEMFTPEGAQIQITVDASDANMAKSYATYTTSTISQHFMETASRNQQSGIVPNVVFLYNPHLKSSYNFVPGIMGLILMLICAMMTSIAIVKEKETGTMEVLLASPVKPIYIILAKMLPYFILSCINLFTILLLSVFVLKVPVAGSLLGLFLVSLLFILTALSLGLLISTVANRQIVAMMFSTMLLMVPTMLLSGMAFPVESMPEILQVISNILPPRWYISAVRKLMIAGLPVTSALKEIVILALMTGTLIAVSLKKFKTRLE